MSERKSWDVQRRAGARQPGRASAVRVPRAAPRPPSGRLRERRKKARKTGLIVSVLVLVLLAAVLIYVLWLPALRIQTVAATGPDADSAAATARQNLTGTYGHIIPRNSIFFFPKNSVREAVLAAYPNISALSISRKSFNSIALSGTPRVGSFLWCGTSIDMPYADGSCFDADVEGLIFKPSGVSTSTLVLSTGSSTPATSGDLRIFSPLDRELGEGQSPVGTHVTRAESIPNALRFVKAIRSLGVPVSALQLRGDEADLWLSGPTRITYVLGQEENAAQLAASVIPTLHLTDGSIQYLDLRFKGRAYVKRYGQE